MAVSEAVGQTRAHIAEAFGVLMCLMRRASKSKARQPKKRMRPFTPPIRAARPISAARGETGQSSLL